MFVIPSPEEVIMCTELTNGLGRRLPSFFTVENVVIVKDESTVHLADNFDSEKKTNGKHPSVKPMCKDQAKKKLTLEELKKKSPPGYAEFEAAIGSKGLDEETALMLWEDIFKPLNSFELLQIGSDH